MNASSPSASYALMPRKPLHRLSRRASFYAWVRKAYEKQNGADASLAYAIKQGMSEKLSNALRHVRLKPSINDFRAGGYNARPKKYPTGYRLGTLSTHATGSAIDIDAATNIQVDEWASLEGFTGIVLNKPMRASLWVSAPEQLHSKIKLMNDTFVANLQAAIRGQEEAGAAHADAVHKAVDANVHLKKLGLQWVIKCRNGFFTLPWTLVKALHEEKLTWGATFSTPDLHHFEFSESGSE